MNEKEFKRLVKKYNQNQLTNLEEKQLQAFEKDLLERNAESVFKSSLHEDQIREKLLVNITVQKPIYKWTKFITIAASFAILIGLGLGFFTNQRNTTIPAPITISNTTMNPKNIPLEDGSTVTLNRQSQITYTEGFEGDFRKVRLNGEAYFQVAKNKDKPFIVETDEVQVEVLGTSFNILESDTSIDITVSTGEVQVYNEQESINLIANEQVQFDRETKRMHTRTINHRLSSLWKQEMIKLKDISMAEFSWALRQTHGVYLDFETKDLANLKLGISYHRQEPIAEIIEKVNYVNDLKLIQTSDTKIIVTKEK